MKRSHTRHIIAAEVSLHRQKKTRVIMLQTVTGPRPQKSRRKTTNTRIRNQVQTLQYFPTVCYALSSPIAIYYALECSGTRMTRYTRRTCCQFITHQLKDYNCNLCATTDQYHRQAIGLYAVSIHHDAGSKVIM